MLLELHGLTLERHGATGPRRVLSDLHLSLDHGQRLALVGANGSGKSSLLRYLAEPGRLPGVRVGYLCQDPDEQLVATTVGGEVTLGRPDADPRPCLAAVGLADLEGVDPRLLSAGQKQRLQLAVVLDQQPDLLLLDEPGSLQDHEQAAWLRRTLATFPGAMIWATQDPDEARWCEQVLALDQGRRIALGEARDIMTQPPVDALWRPLQAQAAPGPPGAEALVLADVACAFHQGGLDGVNLRLCAGERLGLVGPNGSGKSTLLAVMAGLRVPDGGTVTLAGRRLYGRGRPDLDHGLVHLAPQFPEYLFAAGSIAAEARLAGAAVDATLRAAGLQDRSPGQSPHTLSGGQRRRLALALSLGPGRALALLDEPTAALDTAGRQQVAAQVAALDPGTALVMAAHDHEFLRACACRLLEVTPTGLRAVDG